jgi:hypothetical protein
MAKQVSLGHRAGGYFLLISCFGPVAAADRVSNLIFSLPPSSPSIRPQS